MKNQIALNPNPLVQVLKKPASEFTRLDIMKFVEEQGIKLINFKYVAGDGRLKTLNFMINNRDHLENILTYGERVDGSSLFTFIEAGSSDMYVVPRYRTAFIDPFASLPTLTLLCSYFNKDGEPLESSPENTLRKAHDSFKHVTGMEFEAMGELEFYLIADKEEAFAAIDQKGYHESGPFTKFEQFRCECMSVIAQTGGLIKYGHSEVGCFTLGDKIYEQNEIEFQPTNVEDAADQLVIAKWIIRSLAYEYGINITFAPKITTGKAGSGLHVHMRILKDGTNQMLKAGKLSSVARTAIAGMMVCAPSLTAFGNVNPTSYFRLVPHQEAPTNICWGDRNRSVLVRVPLGWTSKKDMVSQVNPLEKPSTKSTAFKQTIEHRGSDGSADIYQLLAGLVVACRHGFEMADALDLAAKTYVDVNIFKEEHKAKIAELEQLPTSCWESADCIEKQKDIFMKYGVFSRGMIDGIVANLKSYKDKDIRKKVSNDEKEMLALVEKYFHCG